MEASQKHRQGDVEGRIPFRSGRMYYVNDQWYFTTREGDDKGPYPSRDEAEAALAMFVRKLTGAADDQGEEGDAEASGD